MKFWISCVTVIALIVSIPAVANAEYITGQNVTADYRFPDLSTNYLAAGGPFTAPVGPGVEFAFFPGFNNPTLDVSATEILITFPLGFTLDPSDNLFDGYVVTSTSPVIPDITGVSLLGTNIQGVVGLSFDQRNVYIDQDTLVNAFQSGAFIRVGVQFAQEVPEPASIALWSMLSVAGLAAWRRRKSAVAA